MLSLFWEYYLLNDTPYEGICDMVRFIFDMSLNALNNGRIDIYEENSLDTLYLTLIAATEFDVEAIGIYADKNNFSDSYKLKGRTLSIKLKKEKVITLIQPKADIAISEPETDNVVSSPVNFDTSNESKDLQVFDILDSDDFEDLKDFISKLNSLLLILGTGPIEEYEVDELVITMLQISKSIAAYNEFYRVGGALGNLGNSINAYKEAFMQKSLELGPLAVAFGGDLSHWFTSLFIKGAPSISFLDDSIISNAKMIESFINPDKVTEVASDDMDDIFDF